MKVVQEIERSRRPEKAIRNETRRQSQIEFSSQRVNIALHCKAHDGCRWMMTHDYPTCALASNYSQLFLLVDGDRL